MGKREFLIAVAFAAVAVVVYQVTAAPAPNGQGFTFARFWNQLRRTMPDRAGASATSTQIIAVPAGVGTVRVSEMAGSVTIAGDTRDDISADFIVRSTSTDDAHALACAKGARLKVETVGDTLAVRPVFQPDCRSVGSLTLKVPRGLAARTEGGAGLHISDVRALHAIGAAGGAVIEHVAGAISGDLRGGTVQITDAGSIDLTLNTTQATITTVHGALRLDVRAGRCTATSIAGGTEVEERQAEIDLDDTKGMVRVGGTGGHVRVATAHSEVRVDVRRAGVSADVTAAVPITLTTTDGGIDLRLAEGIAIDLDAAATEGDITAGEWQLTPTHVDRDAHLQHTFGKTAIVSLHVSRGDITIKKIDVKKIDR